MEFGRPRRILLVRAHAPATTAGKPALRFCHTQPVSPVSLTYTLQVYMVSQGLAPTIQICQQKPLFSGKQLGPWQVVLRCQPSINKALGLAHMQVCPIGLQPQPGSSAILHDFPPAVPAVLALEVRLTSASM